MQQDCYRKEAILSASSPEGLPIGENEEKVVETSADAFRSCRSESVPGKQGSDLLDKAVHAADTCKWYPGRLSGTDWRYLLCVESLVM